MTAIIPASARTMMIAIGTIGAESPVAGDVVTSFPDVPDEPLLPVLTVVVPEELLLPEPEELLLLVFFLSNSELALTDTSLYANAYVEN